MKKALSCSAVILMALVACGNRSNPHLDSSFTKDINTEVANTAGGKEYDLFWASDDGTFMCHGHCGASDPTLTPDANARRSACKMAFSVPDNDGFDTQVDGHSAVEASTFYAQYSSLRARLEKDTVDTNRSSQAMDLRNGMMKIFHDAGFAKNAVCEGQSTSPNAGGVIIPSGPSVDLSSYDTFEETGANKWAEQCPSERQLTLRDYNALVNSSGFQFRVYWGKDERGVTLFDISNGTVRNMRPFVHDFRSRNLGYCKKGNAPVVIPAPQPLPEIYECKVANHYHRDYTLVFEPHPAIVYGAWTFKESIARFGLGESDAMNLALKSLSDWQEKVRKGGTSTIDGKAITDIRLVTPRCVKHASFHEGSAFTEYN